MNRFIHGIGVVWAVGCVSAAILPIHAQDSALQSTFRSGATAMQHGQLANAEHQFRQAVQLAPKMAEAHLDLGLVLGREGKMEEAISSLRGALALDPSLASAHMFLGIFLYQDNHADEARKELQTELKERPDNVEALTWLGTIDLAQDHPERAVVSFDHAAELAPNDLSLLELRGRAHGLVAKDSYSRMAKLDPGSWHVHHVQAQLDADEGKHTEAIAEYLAAIKLQPRDPDLYEELGDQYRSTSALEAAEDAYRKGLALGPANPVAQYNLGSTQIERGESAEGVPLLQSMSASYPGSAVAEYYLGRGLADLGRDQEAEVWLEKGAGDSQSEEIGKRSYYELTRIYRKLHQPERAQTALAKYNRLRLAQDKQGSQQVQDWKKLGDANTAPTAH